MLATALNPFVSSKRFALGLAIVAGALFMLMAPHPAHAATINVTATSDLDVSNCTLDSAISAANLNADVGSCTHTGSYGTDTINIITPGTYTATHLYDEIDTPMTITGTGVSTTTLDSASDGYGIFFIEGRTSSGMNGNLTVTDLTVSGWNPGGGGSPSNWALFTNFGTLTLSNVVIRDNQNSNGGITGVIDSDEYNADDSPTGPLTMTNVTIYNNTAQAFPVSINKGTLTNVTISGNNATTYPGGLFVDAFGTAVRTITLVNVTIAHNDGGGGSGGITVNPGSGSSTVTLTNVLLASNKLGGVTAKNCSTGGITAAVDHSLSSDTTCSFATGSPNFNLNNQDPLIENIADNGGNHVLTHALPVLPVASPAINAGTATGAPAGDARGFAHIGAPDIGAFEADTTAPTVSITAPVGSTTQSGTIPVTATASDNIGVVGVQFKLDGAVLGAEDTSAPYSISWNTLSATNASHTLTAVARDTSGNTTTSATVTITVSNALPTSPVFRFNAPSFDYEHFYTTNVAEKNNLVANKPEWQLEGGGSSGVFRLIPFSGSCPTGTAAVYRFYAERYQNAHHYTISTAERDSLIATHGYDWTYEGPAFCADASPDAGTTPVYRFYSSVHHNSHFYTNDPSEKDWLIATHSYDWSFEGISFYAWP